MARLLHGRGRMQQHEKIPVRILPDHDDVARVVAERIADLIRERAREGGNAVLGLATGSTPIGIYRELIRLHREAGLSFRNVITFNLDEYFPMHPHSVHSYHRYMRENLFDHIDVPDDQIHIPRGDIPRDLVPQHCEEFERAIVDAGGIDFQILGVGRTGHIGFNEPGSGRDSRTRLIALDAVTRKDAAADFFGEENVPREAITMGVGTILEAREIVLLATGEHKAPIIRRTVEGDVTRDIAATFLQEHPDATIYVDAAASSDLTRIRTPWLVRDVEWKPELVDRAVIWLSQQIQTPLLRLTTHDFRENHLGHLIAGYESVDRLTKTVFARLNEKIRDNERLPAGRRVIVFSPHPDDDVISMGGTLRKLNENRNDVTVAYMTSGNIAVFDHEVRRYLDFLRRFHAEVAESEEGRAEIRRLSDHIESTLAAKKPGEVDIGEVQDIKRQIREAEAVSGIESAGLRPEAARFLNLPFYQTGQVRKEPIGPEDVRIVRELFDELQPEIVFVAGDLSDPHGTHRQCKEAIEHALAQYRGPAPEVWYYRGAWQEWPVHEADVLVPLSREELRKKVLAIFKHQSQKDVPPFPGPYDEREFWQRVEARNTGTAREVDALGLPEFHAIEAFVVVGSE